MPHANFSEPAAYLAACFVMGLGIAIDVALASIARTAGLSSTGAMRRWVVRITATHVAFPMIGYYGAIQLERVETIRPALGIVSFLLIGFFIFHMLRELIGESDAAAEGAMVEPGWAIVLAVSWDALWSGPAKSAQAVGWSEIEVLLSFPLAGLVVAAAAILATLSARRLSDNARCLAGSAKRQLVLEQTGVMLEVGIFGYFGLLAAFTFTLDVTRPVIAAAVTSAIVTLLIHVAIGRRVAAAMGRQQRSA